MHHQQQVPVPCRKVEDIYFEVVIDLNVERLPVVILLAVDLARTSLGSPRNIACLLYSPLLTKPHKYRGPAPFSHLHDCQNVDFFGVW